MCSISHTARHVAPYAQNTLIIHESDGKQGAGTGIVECVMPCAARAQPIHLMCNTKGFNQIAQGI